MLVPLYVDFAAVAVRSALTCTYTSGGCVEMSLALGNVPHDDFGTKNAQDYQARDT